MGRGAIAKTLTLVMVHCGAQVVHGVYEDALMREVAVLGALQAAGCPGTPRVLGMLDPADG